MGEAKLYYEDVHEGDEAPVLTHTLERTDLVRYAGLSGDYNPMHHDEVKAQAAGQPSVFGHGMFSMGLLGTALTGYVGVGNLTRYQVRFSRQTWPGEVLSTRVVVARTRVENGRHLVDLDCSLSNQEGEQKVVGTATAELPSVDAPKPAPRRTATKKAATKKTATKKAAAKKSTPKKTAAKKAAAKKSTVKKSVAKKAATKKSTAKRATAAKRATTPKKSTAKRATAAKRAVASKKKSASKRSAARKR